MRLERPEVNVAFNSLIADWVRDTFEHPVSGVIIGAEVHAWTPDYFMDWYNENMKYDETAALPRVIERLAAMGREVIGS